MKAARDRSFENILKPRIRAAAVDPDSKPIPLNPNRLLHYQKKKMLGNYFISQHRRANRHATEVSNTFSWRRFICAMMNCEQILVRPPMERAQSTNALRPEHHLQRTEVGARKCSIRQLFFVTVV
jgi:hypothetical protein